MGGTNSQSKNMKFYALKAKVDETNSPHFALTEKVNDEWKTTRTFDTMEGSLDSAKIEEKDFKGAKFNVFVLVISDENETSKVTLTHNPVTHNIINCLATDCNKLSTYKIYVDKKKSKDGKYLNGRSFVTIVGQKDSLVWSIDPQSAPKKEPVMLADGKQLMQLGKPVWNHDKERKFWEDIFTEKIAKVLGGQPSATPVSNSSDIPPVNNTNDDNDQLPF